MAEIKAKNKIKKTAKAKTKKTTKTVKKEPVIKRKRTVSKKTEAVKSEVIEKKATGKADSNFEISELTDQLELDHFLIDEQIYYSQQLAKEMEIEEKVVRPLRNEIEMLIEENKGKKRIEGDLPQNVQISLDRKGKQVAVKSSRSAINSAFTVNLKESDLKKSAPENNSLKEFKVKEHDFKVPTTSLVKNEKWQVLWFSLKRFFRFRRKPKFNFEDKTPVQISPVWLKLKSSLTFALVALLFIMPIRAYVLVNKLDETQGQVLGVTEEALAEIKGGVASATVQDWSKASLSFAQASSYFKEAQSALSGYNNSLVQLFEKVPLASRKLKDGQRLLKAGELSSQAAGDLAMIVEKINNSKDQDQKISQLFPEIQISLKEIIHSLEAAINQLSEIDQSILPEDYRSVFVDLQSNLPKLLNSLERMEDLIDSLVVILGYNSPQRYLFIFQNNNELRATGGFMGSFALVDIEAGEIKDLKVPGGGFYDLEDGFYLKLAPPEPLQLIAPAWQIWDANWWFDFSTTAQKVSWFLEKSGWPTVDGVMAFNSSVLPEIIQITGDIHLPYYDRVLTADNVIEVLQEEVEFNYDKEENQPKRIIGDLMEEVTKRLISVSKEKTLPFIFTLSKSLQNKDIQLYFADESLRKKVDQFNWSGEVKKTDKDYLAVIRTNIGGGKTDKVIDQQIKHYAYLQPDGSVRDTVAITLTHNGDQNNIFEKAINKSYFRVYVPAGSVLKEATGYLQPNQEDYKEVLSGYVADQDLLNISGEVITDSESGTKVYNEFEKTVFGNWLMLLPGESKTLTLSYELPFKLKFEESKISKFLNSVGLAASSLDNTYSLLTQSQAGAKNVSLESNFYLPDSLNVVWSDVSQGGEMISSDKSVNFRAADFSQDYLYGVMIDK